MSAKINLFIFTLLLSVSSFANPPKIQSQTINNDISVKTKTGGNQVTGQTQDSSIKTGSESVNLQVENRLQTKSSTQSAVNQNTSIYMEASDGSTHEVKVAYGESKFRLTHQEGEATITTTDTQGNTQTRQLTPNELFTAHLDSGTIEIQTSANEFVINHHDRRVVTTLPLEVDTQTQQLKVIVNDTPQTLNHLPSEIYQQIEDNALFDQITDVLKLQLDQNQLIYQIEGKKTKKLLGLIPVTTQRSLKISADSGEIIQTEFPSFLNRLLFQFSR